MIGYYTMEKALRLAGEERGWYHDTLLNAWITRKKLRVILMKNPTAIRIAGKGRTVEYGILPAALRYIGEDPLPKAELRERRWRQARRKGPVVWDRMDTVEEVQDGIA